jgi:hypothetical protein
MERGTFGEHLRREREMRGVSLDEISQATRIGLRFLEALENERWQELPGGVFNRGFIRSIARHLGLDEEAFVAEYAQETHDPPQMAEWRTAEIDRPAPPRKSGGRVVAWLAVLLLLAGAGAGGWWGWMQYGNTLMSWKQAPPAPPRPSPPAAPAGDAAAYSASGGNLASSVAGPGAREPEVLELRVEVSRATEVSVTADGKSLFQGRMARGESRTFKALDRFEVSAKNSFALVLELNGQSMPPVGQPDSPGSVTLTRKDLKKAPGDAH